MKCIVCGTSLNGNMYFLTVPRWYFNAHKEWIIANHPYHMIVTDLIKD